jgi:hypothetical protein
VVQAAADDTLATKRWRNGLLACNLLPAKPKCKATAHLHTGGCEFVYAGIRANACIPADRVRQTVVRSSHGYRHRAPPACA